MSGRSTCPECGTILRIRDRSFVGRAVKCPECKTALRVEAVDRDDDFSFRRLTAADLAIAERKKQGASSKRHQSTSLAPQSRSLLNRVINSPMTAIWLVVFAIVSLFAVLVLNPKFRFGSSRWPIVQKSSDAPANSVQFPEPMATTRVETQEPPEPVITTTTLIDDTKLVSALEPVNLEEPLPWPSIPIASEAVEPLETPLISVVKIDVEAKLAQKIVLYKQPKVSRRILIDALQEQLGVPIRYNVDELGEAHLDDKVTFELEDTTLGSVVKLVAETAGWQVVIEDTGIRLAKMK